MTSTSSDSTSDSRDNKSYIFAFTWSLPVSDRNDTVKTNIFKNAWPTIEGVLQPLAKKWCFQLEKTGASNWHYQGYLNCKQPLRTATLSNRLRLTLPGIHVSVASGAGKAALQAYCMKLDTRQAGPWADHPLPKTATNWDLAVLANPYPWQAEITALVSTPCQQARRIQWIYDRAGGAGKSVLVKKLMVDKVAVMIPFMSTANAIALVIKNLDKNAFFFDMPRKKPKEIGANDLYATIEMVKNGNIVNSKYEVKDALFDPPHVIIFSNWKPDLSCLSESKWDLYTIDSNSHSLVQHSFNAFRLLQ